MARERIGVAPGQSYRVGAHDERVLHLRGQRRPRLERDVGPGVRGDRLAEVRERGKGDGVIEHRHLGPQPHRHAPRRRA